MTQVTLRPNATLVAAQVVTGAATTHEALADDSDSSFVANTIFAFGRVGLTTVAMAAGSITKSVQVRARAAQPSPPDPGRVPTVHCGLCHGNTNSFVDFAISGFGAAYSTRSAAALPISLTQSQVDDLAIAFWNGTGPTDWVADKSEFYLDVVYVEKPAVSVDTVSPDPYTVGTSVPISWVNTLDGDGGGQTRYEVKVFAEADYPSFSGLDPDTGTPIFTTGQVLSSDTSAAVGPLPNGDTYRAYVRVAQTVNGASHWSAWDYDEFALDVDTSDVATITATPEPADARIRIEVERDNTSEAWEFIEVERSVDAGASWQPVRFATYVDATGDADDFETYDYEVGNGQEALYRARASYFDTGVEVVGDWLVTAAPEAWESDVCWLKSPTNPNLNMPVTLDNPSATQSRPVPSGVFHVVGRSHPVVVFDAMAAASSELRILTDGPAEKRALLALLADTILAFHPSPDLMISHADPGGIYLAVQAGNENWRASNAPALRIWPIPYVEVEAPADVTAGR